MSPIVDKILQSLSSLPGNPQKGEILLAVSGGIDSMVMAEAFRLAGFEPGLAHVNYGLRGKDSDDDEKLVHDYAEEFGLPFFNFHADTRKYAREHRLSIQMAAREIRYQWFNELMDKHGFKMLATAHHATDNVETMLLNVLRGSGLEGLKGIPEVNGRIIRPMLAFTRDEIMEFAEAKNTRYREDQSNLTDKYVRNKLRLHVLPVFKEIHPTFEGAFKRSAEHLKGAALVMDERLDAMIRMCKTDISGGGFSLELSKMMSFPHYDVLLYYFLNKYGVNASQYQNILASFDREPGAEFLTSDYHLLRDRDHLVARPLQTSEQGFQFEISGPGTLETGLGTFKVEKLARDQVRMTDSKMIALLDMAPCSFPILVRNWQNGDSFTPLGMSGSKLLSDFFTDLKISALQRQQTPLFLCNNEIIYVGGQRISHRHKISAETTQVLRITWQPTVE